VSVAGAGQTNTIIDGNATDRVFSISNVVNISGITIRRGHVGSPQYPDDGGGIVNFGTLALANSTVSGNSAFDHYFGYGRAGGISNLGTLVLTNSTVSGNYAGDGAGGILNDGTLTLTDSTVSDNSAYNDYFYGVGGGILNRGDLTLTNSTVSGNSVGGFYPDFVGYGRGGGVFNSGTTSITNSTVSGNDAYQGAGIYSYNARVDVSAILTNTIVADNNLDNCNGALDSLGYNLADDSTCGFTEPGDLVVADAMLGPLQDNGGPTETHDLLPGSPAIDAGSPDCPPPATDQRGFARPIDGDDPPDGSADCDIGAVEFVPEPHHAATLIAGAALLGLLYRRRARGLRIG
jgi:hypothetical protein